MNDQPVDGTPGIGQEIGQAAPAALVFTNDEVRNLYVLVLRANMDVKDIPAILPTLHKLDEQVKSGRGLVSL